MSTVLGIDLGTTNCCVSVWKNHRSEIITDEHGNSTIPSVVAFYKSLRLVGKEARDMTDIIPHNTFYDIKRLIGLSYSDKIVQNHLSFFAYRIEEADNKLIVGLTNKDDLSTNVKLNYTPEEISAILLARIKVMAEAYLNEPITQAVITVPAYFTDAQRQATRDAGLIAGLDVIAMINEPTAAAIAYGIGDKNDKKDKIVVVYDLGGGTLDTSLLKITDGVFQVLATTGNTNLGGEDFDIRILNNVLEGFKKEDISPVSFQILKKACENAKKQLSFVDSVQINIPNFAGKTSLCTKLDRETFEKICNDLFIMCMKPVISLLKSADINVGEVSDIVLVGGSTRIPRIRRMLQEFFGDRLDGFQNTVDPDQVVACGAAIHGYTLTHKDDPLSDEIVLLDVIPLSLGVEVLDGAMSIIIPRNTIIPAKKEAMFSTLKDDQDSVSINIYEGERKLTKDNRLLGTFELSGIKKAPRGVAAIKIIFEVDMDGILHITASEKHSGKQEKISVTDGRLAKGRLSEIEIDRLVKISQDNELEDKVNYTKMRLHNELDDLCANIRDNLKKEDCSLSDDVKQKVINELSTIKQQQIDNIDELKRVVEDIKKKYSLFILNIGVTDIASASLEQTGTTVHGDDEPDVVHDNIGYSTTKSDAKDKLLDLCALVKSQYPEDESIRDYIETIYLWIYTNQLSEIELEQKIVEVEHTINKGVKESSFSQLEQMCWALKMNIDADQFSIDDKNLELLNDEVISTIKWLSDLDEVDRHDLEHVFAQKIDYINNMCNQLYSAMVGK